MKSREKTILVVFLMLILFIPIKVSAQGPFYVSFKPGIYSPQSSDLDDFDTGFNCEFAFGWRIDPSFAAEFGFGYFNTEGERTFVGATSVRREELDIDIYPLTFTLKALLPYKKWEFFGLGGVGAYFVYGPYDYYYDDYYDRHHHHYDYDYDYDTIFGGYLGGGVHYNITRNVFVGLEGKYLWTDEARFELYNGATRFKMNGILATGVIGLNF